MGQRQEDNIHRLVEYILFIHELCFIMCPWQTSHN